MNPTKYLLYIIITLCFITTHQTRADEKNITHHYAGKITGLFCNACAAKVKSALQNLEGVSKVRITSTKEQGIQAIQLESTSQNITKEAAIKALGEDAKSFTILSLESAKP